MTPQPKMQRLPGAGSGPSTPPPASPPGGNLGTYTVFLADKVGPAGRVVTFEPQNLVYQNLAANMLFNGYTNVQAINGAAYFKDGLVRMSAKVGVLAGAGGLAWWCCWVALPRTGAEHIAGCCVVPEQDGGS